MATSVRFVKVALVSAALATTAATHAATVTIGFEGVISDIDSVLIGGPFNIGQFVSGSYTSELDPALNPDINGSSGVGQYAIQSWGGIFLSGQPLTLTAANFGVVIFDGGVDGWDAANRLTGIDIGDYSIDSFGISLRDTSGTAFAGDGLVTPPPLSAFDIDQSLFLFTFGNQLAQVDVTITEHAVIPLPAGVILFGSAIVWLARYRRRS